MRQVLCERKGERGGGGGGMGSFIMGCSTCTESGYGTPGDGGNVLPLQQHVLLLLGPLGWPWRFLITNSMSFVP